MTTTIGSGWTSIDSQDTLTVALARCRGSYQRMLVSGHEALSGSTLRGTAREYGASYARSRAALLERLERVLAVSVVRDGSRRVLTLAAR